ncbi:MAG: chromate transporter [Capsulimonadales bacterium]|nr:chromate transporter [Capsulimonadales bacterium]
MPDDNSPAPVPSSPAPPVLSSAQLFGVWLNIGLQSFGGGGATLTLIRRAAVERYRWISEEEFAREWALCLFAPGINLFAITILLGRRIAGVRGILLCLGGMLLPSAAITILLTAFYAQIRDSALVKAALRGVIPASVGLGLLTAYQMAATPVRQSRRDGPGPLALTLFLLLGSAVAVATERVPVLAILGGMGALSALFALVNRHRQAHRKGTPSA